MAGVVTLMGAWWVLEAAPIPVTSILPLLLFPLFGISDMASTGAFYGKSTIFLFLGGFILALGLQETGLHKRIALSIVHAIGASPRKLVLGFMLSTWFLSMWISNTATVMVMLPIALSIVEQGTGPGHDPARLKKFAMALMLGIAYAADMGGMATQIGTAPNIVYKDVFQSTFPDGPEVDFLSWMQFGLPLSIVFVFSGWLLMTRVVFRLGGDSIMGSGNVIKDQLKALGNIRQDEAIAGGVFAFTALLWITGSNLELGPDNIPQVKDEAVAIGGAILLFLFPSRDRPGQALMTWETARKLPWGILLLFGGGFAIAGGFGSSGLSTMIGSSFVALEGLPPLLLVIVVCLLLTFLTEITSNTATTNVVLPILAQASISMGIDPRILMIPATFSASCAFMMPVASPTQAIVFGSGYVPIRQMIRAGIWFNLLGILIVTLLFFLLGPSVWGIDFSQLPAWATP
ncbi:UNVERIFIED_CONTAM: hypothetical protein GTU68_065678 [Idotea baltica]|nr:hypothetical protein [Idotea baltica]